LSAGVLADDEVERFLDVAQRLPSLTASELNGLTVTADLSALPSPKGIF